VRTGHALKKIFLFRKEGTLKNGKNFWPKKKWLAKKKISSALFFPAKVFFDFRRYPFLKKLFQ